MSVIEVGYTQPGGANGGADWINVKNFGAKGNGSHDDTTAIQNAINACTGNANPATTTRTPVAALYIPAGTYKVTSDLIIRSVSGFTVKTDGPNITRLNASGTNFTNAVLFIDGSLDGVYEGFTITGDGTEQVTDAIRLDWTTSAARSTSANMFRDIRVRNLKFVVGLSLEGNGARQVDGTVIDNVVITGAQGAGSWSNSGNWQKGFAFGNGTFGNNYDHVLVGCSAAEVYYGFYNNVSSFSLTGSQPGSNFCDFWITPGAQTTVSNVQSQNSGQFLIAPTSFSPLPNSFNDCLVKSSFFQGAGNAVMTITGGLWNFNNFAAANLVVSAAYVNGTIAVNSAASTRPAVCNFNGLVMFNTKVSCFTGLANAPLITVEGYSNFNPNTAVYTYAAGDISSFYQGGTWTNPGSPPATTPTDIQFFTANGTWNKPAGAVQTRVILMPGGGAAASGASGASGSALTGGGGGAGGPMLLRDFDASQLAATEAIVIGAGGTGGTSVTGVSLSTAGNAGSAGGTTSFGSLMSAFGGAAAGVTNSTVSPGGGSLYGILGNTAGGWGASGGSGAAAGVGVNPVLALCGQGGPSGGSITTGVAAGNGGAGNIPGSSKGGGAVAGASGVVGGASPTSGTASTVSTGAVGPSPGGGASSITGAAQNGANALANSGAGGAGGGASLNGFASGSGGSGGSGWALVITYFQ